MRLGNVIETHEHKSDFTKWRVSGEATSHQAVRHDSSLLRLVDQLHRLLKTVCGPDLSCTSHRYANFPASCRRFGLKMNRHGFSKACDHKYLFDRRLDRFDHRFDRFDHCRSKRCPAPGCINTLANWSTFKSAAGTVRNSRPHSRACIKSNTHSYADSEPDTITKSSTCRNASQTFTPPQIASHPTRAIRVYDHAGNLTETHASSFCFVTSYFL